jgi:flagellar motility protein MotE (MotC chaperone)
MRIPGLSLGFLVQLFSVVLAIFIADTMLAGFRTNQIDTMRKETMRLEQEAADERQGAVMLRAEADELNERLAEVNEDILRLEQRGEGMSLAKAEKGIAHSRQPVSPTI